MERICMRWIQVNLSLYIRTHTHTHIYINIYTSMYKNTYVYVYMYIDVYVQIYTYIHMRIYICMYKYIYVCIVFYVLTILHRGILRDDLFGLCTYAYILFVPYRMIFCSQLERILCLMSFRVIYIHIHIVCSLQNDCLFPVELFACSLMGNNTL